MTTAIKPPVYLLDTMAFVFRAYHAMQRSRPMSTRTGIPTAAVYVFINMINKLRQDFAPQYLAAIYEGGAPIHRNEAAAAMKAVKKFNIKTQQFEEIDYAGYKATRTETPADLQQQQPYIRRALEAFGIPILHHEGFEADDVIGTLSRRLSEEGHPVFIVSSDKDMMQLVTDHVKILNPTKDNLILDPAKVEEVLGVPPARVIDVMALRGDSIDNIPGAPGIGDKGSVELIQQFGTVENALDQATANPDSIKRKTYRESLQNNRDNVLISKDLVTIHCNLPVDYSLEAMSTADQANLAELRSLYTELEFTTLLKDLPSPEAQKIDYILNPTPQDITDLLAGLTPGASSNDLSFRPNPELAEGEVEKPASLSPATDSGAPGSRKANLGKDGKAVLLEAAQSAGEDALKGTSSSLLTQDEDALKGTSSSLLTQDEDALKGTSSSLFAQDEDVLKGTGFSPSVKDEQRKGALAPEGNTLAIYFPEDAQAIAEETAAEEDPEAEAPPATNFNLFGTPDDSVILSEAEQSVAQSKDLHSSLPSATPQGSLQAGLATTANKAILIDLCSPEAAPIREALANEAIPKAVHDLKAVLRTTAKNNIEIQNITDDVMLYSYLVNPTHGSHTLPDVAARFNDRALTQVEKKQQPPAHILPEAASAVLQLNGTLKEQVAEGDLHKTYKDIDLPLVPVLLKMEQAGCRLDTDLLREQNNRITVMMDDLASRIHTMAGRTFNINSPKQLGEVLFNEMGLPKPLKYGKGKVVSTAQDVLEELGETHEVARLVLEHRQLAKLRSNYTEQLPTLVDKDNRVHTTFNQVGTATGRLSSTNPNLQNIPVRTELGREIRAAFIASPGNIILSADYSQIELRLMAHFSQDPLLLNAYRTDIDIHTLTAAEVFGVDPATMSKETRARAKAVNFGIVYGISPFGLSAQLGIDQKEARTYIETYFDRYKGVRTFIETTLAQVRETGKVSTLFGRTRPIPDIQSRNPNARGFAERTAVNTPLQGTAADMIKVAMLHIDAALTKGNYKTQMTLQVHDELLFDAPREEAEEVAVLVKKEMESVIQLSIPIVAEVGQGPNWRDAK